MRQDVLRFLLLFKNPFHIKSITQILFCFSIFHYFFFSFKKRQQDSLLVMEFTTIYPEYYCHRAIMLYYTYLSHVYIMLQYQNSFTNQSLNDSLSVKAASSSSASFSISLSLPSSSSSSSHMLY